MPEMKRPPKPCSKSVDMTSVVKPGAVRRIVREFKHEEVSVRGLVKKWGLNAGGVEQLIRTRVRA